MISDSTVPRERYEGLPSSVDLVHWPLPQGEDHPALQLPHESRRGVDTSEYRFPQADEYQPYSPDLHLRVRDGSGRARYQAGTADRWGEDQKSRKTR